MKASSPSIYQLLSGLLDLGRLLGRRIGILLCPPLQLLQMNHLYLLILFLTCLHEDVHASPTVSTTAAEPIMVCNNGSEYQCICLHSDSLTTHDNIPLCETFVQKLEPEMPVVEMRARHVNLEALLHTSETYEAYFKRRIAQIVSSYCERQVNECPGVSLRINNLQNNYEEGVGGSGEASAVLYAEDESEPLLSQDHVVLLEVNREPGNVTRIQFVITKQVQAGQTIDDTMVIDPVKVKVILGSQAVPLSRILGGIRLESVRVSRIKRMLKPEEVDNTRLKVIIAIVSTFFIVCYIIAAIKLWRQCQRKKKAKRQSPSPVPDGGLAAATTTTVPNYGTIKEERRSSRNGHTISESPHMKKHNDQNHALLSHEIIDDFPADTTQVKTARKARYMFMCDSSQLPREPTFDSQCDILDNDTSKSSPPREHVIIEETKDSDVLNSEHRKTSSPVEPMVIAEIQREDSEKISPEVEIPEVIAEPVPAVVLLPSHSIQVDSSIESPSPSMDPEVTQGLLRDPSPPPHRPPSRRGSRVGEEDLPIDPPRIEELERVLRGDDEDNTTKLPQTPTSPAEHWSSSEGEVDVYYKLSDDEEPLQADDWTSSRAADSGVAADSGGAADGRNSRASSDVSETHEDDEEPEEEPFTYERLQEVASPLPPTIPGAVDYDAPVTTLIPSHIPVPIKQSVKGMSLSDTEQSDEEDLR